MNTKVFVVVGFILLVSLGIYLFRPKEVYLKPECDLATQTCHIKDEDFSGSFEIGPKPLNPVNPFWIEIKLNQPLKGQVKAFLFGLKAPYLSDKITLNKESNKLFKGSSIFPYCTREVMPWKLLLILDNAQKIYKVSLKFKVKRE